jgi:hypothetical protein
MKKLMMVLLLAAAAWSQEQRAPFTLTIVPSSSDFKRGMSVELTHKFHYLGEAPTVQEIYLILTNVSNKPQPVFELGNSWGSYAISLEITAADGKKSVAAYRGIFTKNYPSTFLIPPGEHEVYPIRLDGWWAPKPEMTKQESMPATLKAIYNIQPPTADEMAGTEESDKAIRSVWVGRIESKEYKVTLLQREEQKPMGTNPCANSPKAESRKQTSKPHSGCGV